MGVLAELKLNAQKALASVRAFFFFELQIAVAVPPEVSGTLSQRTLLFAG